MLNLSFFYGKVHMIEIRRDDSKVVFVEIQRRTGPCMWACDPRNSEALEICKCV